MDEKIFWQLIETMRGRLPINTAMSLVLQLLCWWKLSKTDCDLPDNLRLDRLLDRDLGELRAALRSVQQQPAVQGAFMDESAWYPLHSSLDIAQLLRKIAELDSQGLLKNLNLDDVAYWWQESRDSSPSSAPSFNHFMVSLAQIGPGSKVYVPWDASGQLATRVARLGANAYVEVPEPTLAAQLLTLVGGRNWTLKSSDPIQRPSALGALDPSRFDVAVCFPPIGVRYPKEVVDGDLFGRFPEKYSTSSVLQIRHLLAQTRGRIVVAMPNSILFASGGERQLRESLIEAGQLEAVIALPAGLCSHTNIPLSVLVLNGNGGVERVRFVNAVRDDWLVRSEKRRVELADLQSLLFEATHHDSPDGSEFSEDAVSVSRQAIRDNDYMLEPGRYVLDDAARSLAEFQGRYPMRSLGDFFEVVRPRQHQTAGGGDPVREVLAQDLPDYGYIRTASKDAMYEFKIGKDSVYFIVPGDALMAFKGSVGKLGLVQDAPSLGEGGWIAGQSLVILRSKVPDTYPAKALLVYLRSEMGQASLKGRTVGTSIPYIKLSELKELPIPLFSKEQMDKMVRVFDREAQIEEEVLRLRKEQASISSGLIDV
ncbi:N-6 DNA methylase [Crenobacter intestini]|uniref:site-specific DNA-methyltransferase (adenine-specific) n=1 Tax=Crenobacter intestini TaxID=2563443 RepID=A0A4T0UIX4_9NEIS|nr:type I restriction-modification system subunit M/S [Crenobacter intestini]TIC78478.1 hypothetical protein E5K04_15995 [Crenobacter intestini]